MLSLTDFSDNTILMSQMEPLQIGQIMGNDFVGHYVMRTASSEHFEIMDLTESGEDSCWTDPESAFHKVRLLARQESLNVKLYNL